MLLTHFVRVAALALCVFAGAGTAFAEDGYDLWLRYRAIEPAQVSAYRAHASEIVMPAQPSPTLQAARDELMRGLTGMLGRAAPVSERIDRSGALVLGTPGEAPAIAALGLDLSSLGAEGYAIRSVSISGRSVTLITANSDIGVLYGAFAYLRLLQTRQPVTPLDISSAPLIQLRMLDHWDNLDGTIERGYAGHSIFDWHKLPDYVDPRITDYARADASIGINAACVTNVAANATSLTPEYLLKAAALANALRPYGIKLYLTARFSAPIEIGGLSTADPLDPRVRAWWRAKADEIYRYIPDFGGFVVKANSEGQPGPQDYHGPVPASVHPAGRVDNPRDYRRNHADGANMLAEALAPHHGVVLWRAFVYSAEDSTDRAMQAYNEFVPYDGEFLPNVVIQVKNGPIDFQPREPIHPIFGAMPHTNVALEVQLTKEYLGQATHLVYLAPMWKEALDTDTGHGANATVARVVDGSVFHNSISVMAGVSNVGDNRNWTGSEFDQANWYAFGRLAWNHQLSSQAIAEEWTRMTWSDDPHVVSTIVSMMQGSREAAVDYMTPLGLAHQMATGHHYGPGPWVRDLSRPEWNPVYYNRADATGIGFDRTRTGSNAVSQYAPSLAHQYGDVATTPEKFLLWFHHLPWDYRLPEGNTLWEELVARYGRGVAEVHGMRETWAGLRDRIDAQRFNEETAFLGIQEHEAQWWRDASVAYFSSVSQHRLPAGETPPAHTLDYYESLRFPYAPGNPGSTAAPFKDHN